MVSLQTISPQKHITKLMRLSSLIWYPSTRMSCCRWQVYTSNRTCQCSRFMKRMSYHLVNMINLRTRVWPHLDHITSSGRKTLTLRHILAWVRTTMLHLTTTSCKSTCLQRCLRRPDSQCLSTSIFMMKRTT